MSNSVYMYRHSKCWLSVTYVFRIASEHLEGIDVHGRIFLPYPPTLLIVSFNPLIIFNLTFLLISPLLLMISFKTSDSLICYGLSYWQICYGLPDWLICYGLPDWCECWHADHRVPILKLPELQRSPAAIGG
jgi:hypothetical protein